MSSVTHAISANETYTLSGYSPLTVNFDPRHIDEMTFPICSIHYDFGDGEVYTVNRKLVEPDFHALYPLNDNTLESSADFVNGGNSNVIATGLGVKPASDKHGRPNRAYLFSAARGDVFTEKLISDTQDPSAFAQGTSYSMVCAYSGVTTNFPISANEFDSSTFSMTAISAANTVIYSLSGFLTNREAGTHAAGSFRGGLSANSSQSLYLPNNLSSDSNKAHIAYSTGVWYLTADHPGFTFGDQLSATLLRDSDLIHVDNSNSTNTQNTLQVTTSYTFMLTGNVTSDMAIYSVVLDGSQGSEAFNSGDNADAQWQNYGGTWIDGSTKRLSFTRATHIATGLDTSSVTETYESLTTMTTGAWYTVTEAWDHINDTVVVYINGNKEQLTKTAGTAAYPVRLYPGNVVHENIHRIGGRKFGAGASAYVYSFQGVMSDFVVFNGIIDDLSIPYPSDMGDPRNEVVTHKYNRTVYSQPSSFIMNLTAFECNTFNTMTSTVTVAPIFLPGMIGSDHKHQFTDIHLVKSRMFNTDNLTLYTFETEGSASYFTNVLFDPSGTYIP